MTDKYTTSPDTGKPELKPCPFCGGEASATFKPGPSQADDYAVVGCTVCPGEMTWLLSWIDDMDEVKARLVAAWNRRAGSHE